MPFGSSGSTRLTGDNPVGPSGQPIRVYSATWLSGATAGDLVLRNGTSGSDPAYVTKAGVISDTVTQNFEGGLLFPSGCWFDKDTNVTAVVVEFAVEL